MIARLHQNFLRNFQSQIIGLQTKVMTAKNCVMLFGQSHQFLLFQEKVIQKQEMMIWNGDYINTDIWLKIYLHDSSILDQLQPDMIN